MFLFCPWAISRAFTTSYRSESLLTESNTTFAIGQTNSPDAVRSVTTRTWSSSPGWTRTMRASCHLVGGDVSCRIKYRRPIGGAGSLVHHLGRCINEWRYSFDQYSQKWSRICCKSCQRVRRVGSSVVSDGSGTAVKAEPTRKCPGVRAARSPESSESAYKGREFRQAST